MSISIISSTACKLKQPEREENELLTEEYPKRGETIKKVPPTEMKFEKKRFDWSDLKEQAYRRRKSKG